MKSFKDISKGDIRALIFLLVFIVVITVFYALKASLSYREQSASDFLKSRIFLNDLHAKAVRISVLEKSTLKTSVGSDQTLLAIVSDNAKDKKIAFDRFQPEGDNRLLLWMEDVPFDIILWWLFDIERKYGIRVEKISVERTNKREGFVNVRLTLMR